MVTWVVEQNVFAEVCFDQMIAHFKARGIPYHVVKVIPFIHEIEGKVPEIEGPVVVYGSIGVQKLAAKHGWFPGVFNASQMDEWAAMSNLGKLYLNHDLSLTTIYDLKNMRDNRANSEWFNLNCDEATKALIDGDEFFIKPNTDTKEFAGAIVQWDNFAKWYDNLVSIGYIEDNPKLQVVISKPKKLGCEWRVVVVDGKISSYSLYRQWQSVMPEHHILPEVEALVKKAHKKFKPSGVYVIDVAQVGDEFKVIEYNTFNSAGMYACDVTKVIDDVSAFVEKEADDKFAETFKAARGTIDPDLDLSVSGDG